MDSKETMKLTKNRLRNTKIISAKLSENKRKLTESALLKYDKEYINSLNIENKIYKMELCHIKNAMDPLSEMEKRIIVLNLFESVKIKDVASQFSISITQVNRMKRNALETIAEILYH